MNKIKKLIFGIFIFVSITCINNPEVNAISGVPINYNELNPGDLITVHVAKDKTEQFYYVKECGDDRFVYAILKDPIDLDVRTYEDAENFIHSSTLKNRWGYLDSEYMYMPEIYDLFDEMPTIPYSFTNPTWINSDYPYWIKNNDTAYSVGNGQIIETDKSQSKYVRPLIQVNKREIEGCVKLPKDWNEFANLLKYYFENVTSDTNEVTITNNSLKVHDKSIDDYSNFKYENGYFTLIPNKENPKIDSDLSFDIFTIMENLLSKQITGSIFADDNPEHIILNMEMPPDEGMPIIKELSMNLKYFFNINYEKQDKEIINNPDTGNNNIIGMIIISIISSLNIYLIIKKNKIKQN